MVASVEISSQESGYQLVFMDERWPGNDTTQSALGVPWRRAKLSHARHAQFGAERNARRASIEICATLPPFFFAA
jgi:hypothetical protein